MANQLTKKEKGFAEDYMETGNGTESVLNNYNTNSENSAAVIASENLRKVKIMKYLEEKSETAVSNIFKLANNAENEAVRLSANKDILDRSGFKAVEKSVNLNISAEITNPKVLELAQEYEKKIKEDL